MKTTKIVSMFVFTLMILSLMFVSVTADDGKDEIDDLKDFLKQDDTSKMIKLGDSFGYAYIVARNANEFGIPMGIARFWNKEKLHGWSYAYYITSDGQFIFINPFEDRLMNYDSATKRLGDDVTYAKVKYYYHYPYTSMIGAGEMPDWQKRMVLFT